MADNTGPWSWISKWNDTARGATTVPVQFSHSVVSDSATPRTTARQASLSITNSQSLPKPMSIELVMPSFSVILISSCLQSFPASGSFQMSQFFASGDQGIVVSTSTSVGGLFQLFGGRGGDFQVLGHHPLLDLLTPWNCLGTSGCVVSLADWGSRSSLVCHLCPTWIQLVYVVPLGYVILPKAVPCPFPSCYNGVARRKKALTKILLPNAKHV